MIVILKLVKEVGSFDEFVAEVTKRGLKGNPLSNLSYCYRVWLSFREVDKN